MYALPLRSPSAIGGAIKGRPVGVRTSLRPRFKNLTHAAAPAKEQQRDEEAITPKSEDFSKWYIELVKAAELTDYGPVRGTMVIRPYGFAIWEAIQRYLDARFKERGVENAYFPQLIPMSFLTKEADHVEGFAPELAVVTQAGGKELEEPLVVRPTSETMVNHMLSQWVQSYRDLPLQLNQWCNVHRWEMRTRPFIRTSEFLWQEGHTAHATKAEAHAMAREMIDVYTDFAVTQAAIPVIAGRKSWTEAFAGAKTTFTIEAMMGDTRALQAGTSHDLGDNFSKAFDTEYLSEGGKLMRVHQSSWGVSTRLIGGIIMAHGDDKGLRLPPNLAPIQVVIVPVIPKNKFKAVVMPAVEELEAACAAAGIRAKVDDREGRSAGWKFNFWELKGVPVRVEVGPRDVESSSCVVARRDRPGKEGKEMGVSTEPAAFTAHIQEMLQAVQAGYLEEATAFRDAHIVDVASLEELTAAVEGGKWARGPWAGSAAEEKQIKEDTGATLRCFPFDQPEHSGTCFHSGKDAKEVAIFAKAY